MRAIIAVDGLRARRCLAAVERAVLASPAVTSLDIDLATETIVVDFDERAIDAADLRDRVRLAVTRGEDVQRPSGGRA